MKNRENIIPGTFNQKKPDVPGYAIYNSAVKNDGAPATGPNNWAYDEFEKNEDAEKTETSYDTLIDEVEFHGKQDTPATDPDAAEK